MCMQFPFLFYTEYFLWSKATLPIFLSVIGAPALSSVLISRRPKSAPLEIWLARNKDTAPSLSKSTASEYRCCDTYLQRNINYINDKVKQLTLVPKFLHDVFIAVMLKCAGEYRMPVHNKWWLHLYQFFQQKYFSSAALCP